MTQVDALASRARALGLSERSVLAVLVQPNPEAALQVAAEVVAVCRVADRPELVDAYITDVQALRVRVCADRARADDELHIDTAPPAKNTSVWTQRNTT